MGVFQSIVYYWLLQNSTCDWISMLESHVVLQVETSVETPDSDSWAAGPSQEGGVCYEEPEPQKEFGRTWSLTQGPASDTGPLTRDVTPRCALGPAGMQETFISARKPPIWQGFITWQCTTGRGRHFCVWHWANRWPCRGIREACMCWFRSVLFLHTGIIIILKITIQTWCTLKTV